MTEATSSKAKKKYGNLLDEKLTLSNVICVREYEARSMNHMVIIIIIGSIETNEKNRQIPKKNRSIRFWNHSDLTLNSQIYYSEIFLKQLFFMTETIVWIE